MVIGVTGGVGAGKSTVLGILKDEYGAVLIMADDVARYLMEPGGASYAAVVSEFGSGILQDPEKEDSPVNRKALAAIVFSDPEKLKILNSLTHPAVRSEIKNIIKNEYVKNPDAIIVVEAALLIEAGYEDMLDCLCVVTAEREVRIARLEASRGYSRERSENVIASQLSDKEFAEHADLIIDNSGDIESTAGQIREIMFRFIN